MRVMVNMREQMDMPTAYTAGDASVAHTQTHTHTHIRKHYWIILNYPISYVYSEWVDGDAVWSEICNANLNVKIHENVKVSFRDIPDDEWLPRKSLVQITFTYKYITWW